MLTKLFIAGVSAKSFERSHAPSRPKGLDKHLAASRRFGFEEANLSVPLFGYCPARPPKYGVIAMTENEVIFCQKSRMGETLKSLQFSHISSFEVSRFIKHHVIRLHSPGAVFEFATRMPDKDVQCFLAVLRKRLNISSSNSFKT